MMKNFLMCISFLLSFSVFAAKVTMTCPSISCMSCQGKITKALTAIEGVDQKSVEVDVDKKTVTFDYKLAATKGKKQDEEKTKIEEKLTEEMKKLGYPIVGDFVWDHTDKDRKSKN
jgi:copper chaperone CopZ